MTDLLTLANAARLVIAAGIFMLAWWGRGATMPEPAPTLLVDFKQETMDEGDLVEASAPRKVTVYRVPDSSDTRTDCNVVPLWMPKLSQSTDSTAQASRARSQDSTSETPTRGPNSPGPRLSLRNLGYVIVPMTKGRPNISISPDRVVLPGVDPRNGAGLRYEYPIPKPSWALTARLTGTAGLKAATLTGAPMIKHRTDWGTFGIGPAGQVIALPDRYIAQKAITFSYEVTLTSR